MFGTVTFTDPVGWVHALRVSDSPEKKKNTQKNFFRRADEWKFLLCGGKYLQGLCRKYTLFLLWESKLAVEFQQLRKEKIISNQFQSFC